ncbi:MAG: hypothetical protein ACOCVF_01375 [bacterium]
MSRVTFNKRTFSEIRQELVDLIREYYPEVLQDFTDSSVGSMLLDLNAGVANNLSVNTDRAFQETQLENAQQTASILNIARNLGFNLPPRRPSATVVDFTVTVPARGDQPNTDYYPTLLPGSQVQGGGNVFETQDTIDWSLPISNLGDANRSIIPNFDANGIITSYNVTKREVVINGSTSTFRRSITSNDVVSFFQLNLPDFDVLEIQDVILIPGTNFTGNPTEEDFQNPDYKFYEVDYLAQQRIFVEDNDTGTNTLTTGSTGIKAGKWINITKKFIKEFLPNGLCRVTFGGGNGELDVFKDGFAKAGVTNQQFLNSFLENTALGERLKNNHTLFIRYRTGGGSNSNVGTGVLTGLGNVQFNVRGPRQDFNNQVRRSLSVSNPIPAIGGNDGLTIEQIRNLVKYNFSSQNRDVTINDYLLQIFKIPGRFGSPFKANAFRENNKVVIPILSLDESGKLSNTSNTLLKSNIAEYLTEFRMVNDYIEIRDGRIFNLAFEIEVFADNSGENQIINSIIQETRTFLNINNRNMNEDIFISNLSSQIRNVTGVINLLGIKVFNKVGNGYSLNSVEQELISESTGEIRLINNAIYSTEDGMFEIKFPQKDIKVILRRSNSLNV